MGTGNGGLHQVFTGLGVLTQLVQTGLGFVFITLGFGGLQGLTKASQHEIEKVPGISNKIAEDIYAALHNV